MTKNTNHSPEALIDRIGVLISKGQRAQAARALASVLARELEGERQLLRLARMAHTLRQPELERKALARAHNSGCLKPEQQAQLIELHLALGDPISASNVAEKMAACNPDDEGPCLRWVSCLMAADQDQNALGLLADWINRNGASADVLLAWGDIMIERKRAPRDLLDQLPALMCGWDSSWIAHYLVGRSHAALDEIESATASLGEAVRLAPRQVRVWRELGLLQRRIGMKDKSQDSFHRVLELDPTDVSTLRLMGYEHTYQGGDFNFGLVNRALNSIEDYAIPAQIDIHYAAAKAFEDVGNFDAAFAHFRQAGALHKELHPWTEGKLLSIAEALTNNLTRAAYDKMLNHGFSGDQPVFVIGMPRSGTTLVEQILASHPDVFGAGELKLAERVLDGMRLGRTTIYTRETRPEAIPRHDIAASPAERGRSYLEGVRAVARVDALRIIDKMPGNYLWAGLISAMLPGARFIHCRRHPIDCCLSMFKLHFGAEVPYSYDLSDLGKAYRIYHEMMQHWSRVLPSDRLLHVRYEDLVHDLEETARRLVAFLDLPWNNSCLNYRANSRQVRTASAAQVRRPVYTGSVGAWRHERHLRPLIDDIGDLVEAYQSELEEGHVG